jgi:hypothetical protein
VYRVRFEDTFPSYYTLLMKLPVTGLGALLDGAGGRGLVFQMAAAQRIRGHVEPGESGTHAPVSACGRRDSTIAP